MYNNIGFAMKYYVSANFYNANKRHTGKISNLQNIVRQNLA